MMRSLRLLALLLGFSSLSFAADRYADAGFPAASREWSEADYAKASALIQEKKLPLPSALDHESSALFWRIANSVNFEHLRDKKIPAFTRYQTARELEKSFSAILGAYIAGSENTALDSELDNLVAARLYLTRHAVLLVEELLPEFRKHPPTFEANKKILIEMRAGIGRQFSLVDELLDEKYASQKRSYSVLLTATADSLREAKRALTPETRADLHRRFQKRHAEFQNLKNKIILGSIVSDLSPEPDFFPFPGMSAPPLWP